MLAFGRGEHYRERAMLPYPCGPASRLLRRPLKEEYQIRACPTARVSDTETPHVLVVSRKVGERILIGDKIAITVVKVSGGGVRIGVEAPAELAVMREELAEEIRKAERAAMETSDFSPKSRG
jgi:carbon storage regulator